MDWKTASAYYEAKLTDVLNIQRHALDLAKLPQTGIAQDLKQILIDEAIPANRQLERLKNPYANTLLTNNLPMRYLKRDYIRAN